MNAIDSMNCEESLNSSVHGKLVEIAKELLESYCIFDGVEI